ncbi:MAG: pyruvate, phosphate dikinase, partial [Alphaproteobacteria bacterium]|nr:pyruvate, phosphate dikinase [Alphaproteobacteria bacterium]
AAVMQETGETVEPEIMMPLIATKRELDILKDVVDRVAREVKEKSDVAVPYMVGTMIELPRAALLAGEIAESAAFFSFGTNDLTQTVYGISRDDSASFSGAYQKLGIFEHDPFVTLDRVGVGEMIKIAAERGRKTRADIKLGICGEHGGDPASIEFCREIGLDYVSCSPYRVPIARLAAAQAELTGGAGASTA